MKTKIKPSTEKLESKITGGKTITLQRAKEIMDEEGIEYTDEELKEVLDFISNVILITTSHYERIKEKETKVISINISTHETKSISLHPSKHRRAS